MDSNQVKPQVPHQTNSFSADDEIDLKELFWILWAEKWVIVGVTAFFAVASVIYALMQTNIYRAEAVLAPAETEQSTGGLAAQFGGAAALLGVNIGGSIGDNVNTAIATLQSRQFLGRFIEEYELLVPLFATAWQSNSRTSVIDEELYNSATAEWVCDDGKPTEYDAYRLFNEILSVTGPDRNTGLITVAINWHNPVDAANWVNNLVSELNQEIRSRDVQEANNAIMYLRSQLNTTQLVEMQRVFYQLIESQTRVTMLADVRDEYMFRVIDPAVVPDRRFSPRRSFIAVVGTIAGGFLSLVFVFILRISRKIINSTHHDSRTK
jgi:uncharacterized protein involved in exopolysaccharide biosynthesis